VILDEPTVPEYKIRNDTKTYFSFCKHDIATETDLGTWTQLKPGEEVSFVWDLREKLIKRLKIKILEEEHLLQFDKCSEYSKKREIQ